MGDDLLELAKAKELASVMGGAWHSEEVDDSDSDSEQTGQVRNREENLRASSCTLWQTGLNRHSSSTSGKPADVQHRCCLYICSYRLG